MTILECGLDEAGRGPLAGPVTAGCVILPEDFPFEILNDSKKLSEKKREEAEKIILEKACWGLGVVDQIFQQRSPQSSGFPCSHRPVS